MTENKNKSVFINGNKKLFLSKLLFSDLKMI